MPRKRKNTPKKAVVRTRTEDNLRRLRAHIQHLQELYRVAQEHLPRAVAVACAALAVGEWMEMIR